MGPTQSFLCGDDCRNCSDKRIAEYVGKLFDRYEARGIAQRAFFVSGRCRRMEAALFRERARRGWVSKWEETHRTAQIALARGEEKGMARESALQVFGYEGKEIRTTFENGEVWVAAKDVCEVLEYSIDGGISKYIAAVPEEWKGGKRISTPGGTQNLLCLSEQGLYFFLARSDKPKALPFQKWIAGEVLPSIRKTGEYATPKAQREKADKNDELARKRLEIMERNANCRMAMAILKGLEKFDKVMSEASKKVCAVEYIKLTTKQEMLGDLPKLSPGSGLYDAKALGAEFGVSANRIGRIANANGLKCPEGESGEYGEWVRNKSLHSSHECMQFLYNEKGRRWFTAFFAGKQKTA